MLSPTTDRFRDDDPSVHQAARFGLVMGSLGVGFMVLAAVWVRHCSGYDTAACSMPYRTVLALAGPLFLFGSGVWAFVRTYRAWRGEEGEYVDPAESADPAEAETPAEQEEFESN